MLTKTTFLRYLNCPKDFWLYHYKPELFKDIKINDFQQQLIDQGYEVEQWARKLFPDGMAIENFDTEAVKETQSLLSDKKPIFQATFSDGECLAMVDVLVYDPHNQYWIINEVKGSTSKEVKKEEHYIDACFQKIITEKTGITIGKVNLIELNKEFRKDRDIIPSQLLQITDITEELEKIRPDIEIQIQDALRLLIRDEEPRVCNCIYKSRANHCDTFKYSHPEVPDYSVHDITRIGLSPKKLEQLIDEGYLEIEDIPLEFELSPLQTNHVHTTISGEPIIKEDKIREELQKLEYPFYFLDYETFPTAVPKFDNCYPYQQIPFQYSLHILEEPNGELKHKEFLASTNHNPIAELSKQLVQDIGDTGNVIVWNKKFERKCNEDMAEQMPEFAEQISSINNRIYDLMDIFAKQYYVHPDFKGSCSIKYVLPVLVSELSYKNLEIQDGGMACNSWKQMIFDELPEKHQINIAKNLLKYCELDTLAMVRILEELLKI